MLLPHLACVYGWEVRQTVQITTSCRTCRTYAALTQGLQGKHYLPQF